jgi:hypothetical protein
VFFSFIAYSTPLPLSRQLSVSEDEVNLVFNNATQKVIKNTFKHAPCIFVAAYYTQLNLLPFYTQVLKLLIFYIDMQM